MGDIMNKEQLGKLCGFLGKYRLAEMMGISRETMRQKVNGDSDITRGDELRVRQAISDFVTELAKLNPSHELYFPRDHPSHAARLSSLSAVA